MNGVTWLYKCPVCGKEDDVWIEDMEYGYNPHCHECGVDMEAYSKEDKD